LYYYEGNTLDSLAEKTGISRNSVFTTIDKVRKELKKILNE
jgi:DNA-binding transcriptional regulator LsrR (DeoR family)